MISDKKLLMRAAWITLIIALVGVGTLYAVLKVVNSAQPELLDNESGGQVAANTAQSVDALYRGPADLPAIRQAPVKQDIDYIERVFPVISGWQLEEIQPYFAPATLSRSQEDPEVREVLAVLSNELGALKSWESPVPDQRMTANQVLAGPYSPQLAEYRFVAQYEQGLAQVNMVLESREGRNALYAFRIDVVN